MKKYVYHLMCAALLLTAGCTKDGLLSSGEDDAQPMSGNLSYEIADFANRTDGRATRSITPSDEEYRIESVCYLFFNQRSRTCVGYLLYDDLDVHVQTGRLPFDLPTSVPTSDGVYVRVIANYKSYMPDSDMADERYGELFFGMREDDVATLTSDLGYGANTTSLPYREVGEPLLMTGRFTIDLNQNSHSVTLVRKQVALDIDIVKPDWIAGGGITLSNLPMNVALFTTDYLAKPSLSTETYYIPFATGRKRIYVFPSGTDGEPIEAKLDARKAWQYIEMRPGVNDVPVTEYKQEFGESTYEQVPVRTVQLSIPDHYLPVKENHYVLFSLQQSVSDRNKFECRMNGWSVDKGFEGKIYVDKEGNGIAFSTVALDMPYADMSPLPLVDNTQSPSGEVRAKIYIPTFGFPPSWDIGGIGGGDGGDWLTAEKADNGQSLLLTAAPNITFNADGTTTSSVRRTSVHINIYFTDGTQRAEDLLVTQAAAPALGDVRILVPYVKPDGTYDDDAVMGWASYIMLVGNNEGATAGVWGTLSADGNYYGSEAARGKRLTRGFGPGVDMSDILTDARIRDNFCLATNKMTSISAHEAVFNIYPRIRKDYFPVGGTNVLIYYLPGETGFTVFPIAGNKEDLPSPGAAHLYMGLYTFKAESFANTNERVRGNGLSSIPTLGSAQYWNYGLSLYGGQWSLFDPMVVYAGTQQTYVRCQRY